MTSQQTYKFMLLAQSAVFIVIFMYLFHTFDFICGPRHAVQFKREAAHLTKTYDVMTVWNGLNIRGPLSDCSITDIMKRPNVVLLTSTNLGFLDMTVNMLMSIRKVGLCVQTTIIAEDQTTYRYLRRIADRDPAVHVVMTNSKETESSEVLRQNYQAYFGLLKKRQGYILNLLERGLQVLFTDADTFWFRDPFPYFKGDFDMSMMDPRSPYPIRSPKAHYCAGFAYFKPTNVTVLFVKAWIRSMEGRDIMDQVAMNNMLKADLPVHVNVRPLDPNIFPPGPTFYQLLAQKANYSTVVMHAASIHGHGRKIAKFKSSNMWLVKATSAELIARQT